MSDQTSRARGHKVYEVGEDWFYEDGSPCTRTNQKPCESCGLTPKPWSEQEKTTAYAFTEVNFPMDWGPDPCLGVLDNVLGACCGHGGKTQPYVVVIGDKPLRDKDAIEYFSSIGVAQCPST